MYIYSVKLEKDGNTVLATCPDLPEVASVGDTEDEALLSVVEAIELAIQCRMNDREAIPLPAKLQKNLHAVRMPVRVIAKAQLHNEMLAQGVRKADLARLLKVLPPQIDRLLNPRHSTKLETLEAAFASLGKTIEFRVA